MEARKCASSPCPSLCLPQWIVVGLSHCCRFEPLKKVRCSLPDMTKDLIGKLFGDKGYISQKLFEELYERGLQVSAQ